ncbi:MAG: hypothetical protein P8P37_02440 [Candidatus Marinimicrobia bacterium]|nr:hypothetical protein [Candidatus Neomarinimicrobiota bacterium]
MALTEEQKAVWKPFLNLNNSLYRTVEDYDGTSSDFVHVIPKYHALNFNPINWDWQVIGIHSNYKNSVDFQTNVEVDWIGSHKSQTPLLKISNIKAGEVVFVELFLECDGDDGELVFNKCNIIAYRGDPVNTRFRIFYPKNGKLASEIIYDSPIEMQIQSAYKGQPMHTRLGDSMQGNRQTIEDYLSEYDTEIQSKSVNELLNQPQVNHKVQGQSKRLIPRVFSFVKEENVFYAHGRSIDLKSIETLQYQNPANFFYRDVKLKPNKGFIFHALKNRRMQHPGYNSIIMPMLNPYMPKQKSRLYFPGRSGHATTSSGENCCNETTNNGTNTPSYSQYSPPSPGSTPTSQSFCGKDKCK